MAAPLIQRGKEPLIAFISNVFGLEVASGGGSQGGICVFAGLSLLGKIALNYAPPAACFVWVAVAFLLSAVGPAACRQPQFAMAVNKAALATTILAYSTLLKTSLTLTTVC